MVSGNATDVSRENKVPDAPQSLLAYGEHEITAPVESAWEQLKSDYMDNQPNLKAESADFFDWNRAKQVFGANVAAGKLPLDAFNLVTAPVRGAVHGAIIRPLSEAAVKYLHPQTVEGGLFSAKIRPETEAEVENDLGNAMLTLGPEGEAGAPLAAGKGPLASAPSVAKAAPATTAAPVARASPLEAAAPKMRPAKTAPPNAAAVGAPPESPIGKSLDKAAAPKVLPQPEGKYAESVKALQKEGVDLTLGQTHGGVVRRAEEAHKSNPLTGHAIREAENRSIQTFNRATYNRVLANIGEKFEGDEIGRAGIKQVGDKLDKAYESIKPKLALKPDDQFIKDMADTRTEASEMPDAQEKQFETILNNRLLKRVGPDGNIDGATFKQIESEIGHLAAVYKSSGDAAHRELGSALSDVVTHLRENLERSSDPSVREELKKINTGWAMLTRIENAAGRRAGSGGLFTTGDLLQAVKSGDRSSRRRTFARGDALMQDFAQTAHDVLPNRLPDSGTAEREQWNNLTGIILRGAGTVTNPLYKSAAEAMKKTYAEPPP